MFCLDCTASVAHAGVTTVDGIATDTATAVIVTVAVTIATAACAPTGVCRYWHWFPQELLDYLLPIAHAERMTTSPAHELHHSVSYSVRW